MRLAIVLCLLPLQAAAVECIERTRAILSEEFYLGEAYRAETRTIFGEMETVSLFEWQNFDHHRTTPLSPEGQPATLYHSGVTYTEGADGIWAVSNRADPETARQQAEEYRARMAEHLYEADCAPLAREGRTFQAITAHLAPFPPFEAEVEIVLFFGLDGRLARMERRSMMSGQEMTMEQDITPAPGLALPVPVER